jgi:hypothetical protein
MKRTYGRANSRRLVSEELAKRIAELREGGSLGPDIKTVAASLSDWLRKTHPLRRKLPRRRSATASESGFLRKAASDNFAATLTDLPG